MSPKTSLRGRVRAMPAGGTACREMRLTISVSVPAALSRSIWYAGQQEHGVVPGGAWRGCTHAPPDSQSLSLSAKKAMPRAAPPTQMYGTNGPMSWYRGMAVVL